MRGDLLRTGQVQRVQPLPALESVGPSGRPSAESRSRPELPRVSVLIPLHNYERYLEECVASVVGQPGVDLDVVIIDDASTDGSLDLARRLAAEDDRIQVVHHRTNRGMIPTVNEGLWGVEGDYVVKLDADDLLTPGCLARAVSLLEARPDVGFVYGHPVTFRSGSPPPARQRVRSWTIWPGWDWIGYRCRRKASNIIYQPEVVIRSSTLRSVGRYREDLPHTSDMEMWLRMAAVANVGRVNGCDQGYYRIHPLSMQRTVNSGRVFDLEGRLRAFEALFDGYGRDHPRRDELMAEVRRNLARVALDLGCQAIERHQVQSEPVEDYIRFAAEMDPGYKQLREWRALQRRSGRQQESSFLLERTVREVKLRLWWRRWRWSGQ